MNDIQTIEPQIIWKHFYALTQIPRPSKFEKAAIEHIEKFAKDLGLETLIDKPGNLIVRKGAQNSTSTKMVTLQSHVDMVPQKNNDKVHDFKKDPIETYIDNGWLKAKGTTLGADNGLGCAAMMAVLESKNISHGPIEALFTMNEEAGMEGAFELDSNSLKGDILINLDTEEEGEICMGCAGGIDANVANSYSPVNTTPDLKYFSISLKGLKGGHSGIDIHLGRGNSNKIMGRILYTLIKNTDLNIISFTGGNMRNAIPREAECVVAVKPDNEAALHDSISHFQNTLKAEFKKVEDDIELQLSEHEAASKMMSDSDSLRFISLIHACPNGVVRMSNEIKGLVETSVNLSIITMADGLVDMQLLIRSAMDSAKYALGDRLSALFELEGCKVTFGGDYPGWSPNSESYILNVVKGSYEELYSKTPHINAVHAGLECGIIGGKYPNLDMVSFGPTIEHPHSPDEKAHIDSVGKFWDLLVKTLKNIN